MSQTITFNLNEPTLAFVWDEELETYLAVHESFTELFGNFQEDGWYGSQESAQVPYDC